MHRKAERYFINYSKIMILVTIQATSVGKMKWLSGKGKKTLKSWKVLRSMRNQRDKPCACTEHGLDLSGKYEHSVPQKN